MRRHKVLIAAVLAILASQSLALAETAEESKIVELVDKAKILAKDYRVVARVISNEATVSTYGHRNSKDLDQDCKIDATLIARELIFNNKDLGLVRLNANFYDPELTGSYRQVVITKAEIMALGANQISQEEFLSSLRCNLMQDKAETVNAPSPDPASGSTEPAAGSTAPAKGSSEPAKGPAELVKASEVKKEIKKAPRYQSDSYGFSFNIPNGWTVDDNIAHGGGKLLKLFCRATDYNNIEISLTASKKSPAECALEQRNTFNYSGVKVERYEQAKVGQGGYNGALSVLTYPHESGEPYYEMHWYFGNPGRMYNIWGWCTKKDYRYVAPAFWEVMNSMLLSKADPAAKVGIAAAKPAAKPAVKKH